MLKQRLAAADSAPFLTVLLSVFSLALMGAGPIPPAERLSLNIPSEIRAGANLEYRVVFDEKSDVTDRAKLTMPFRADEKGQGLVFIPPAFKNGFEWIDIRVEWTENSKAGKKVHTGKKRVKVIWDPERIVIGGPQSVQFGESVTLTATGQYPDSTLDLSHAGNWFSQFGEITAQGVYKAPKSGAWSFDWIQFRFGTVSESSRIRFY